MMIKRNVISVTVALLLSGCGTINTVFRGEEVAAQKLHEWKTHCSSIPRVYSGIFYDLCVLNADPKYGDSSPAASSFIPLQIIDFVPSVILDTLVLPYTIYRQSADGNIEISE